MSKKETHVETTTKTVVKYLDSVILSFLGAMSFVISLVSKFPWLLWLTWFSFCSRLEYSVVFKRISASILATAWPLGNGLRKFTYDFYNVGQLSQRLPLGIKPRLVPLELSDEGQRRDWKILRQMSFLCTHHSL